MINYCEEILHSLKSALLCRVMPRACVDEEPRRIAPNGYKLPRQLPEGLVIKDIADKKWKIGKSIGLGGFGEIYMASDDLSGPVGNEALYVAKVEAHSSGPLFVEMNYYLRAAKREMVDEWVARQDLKFLGMPFYIGSGSCWYKGERFRFLVIPRYSHDLEKTFQERGQRFHLKTVLSVALQVIDTLEYIHKQGYVHADIKASNLLVGLDRDEQDRVFLVDFGLASRYRIDGVHKEFKPDLRKAHDGTLEFTSRDAHQGAHSRRGDLEVLGYNLLKWLCSRLPWEPEEEGAPLNPEYVHLQKEGFMKDPVLLTRACFPNSQAPAVLERFLRYVNSLGFETRPDYELCRKMFRQGLREAGFKDDGRLELHSEPVASPVKNRKRGKKRPLEEPENIAEMKPRKVVRVSPAQPCRPKNFNTRATRSSPTSPMLRSREHFDWERVLQSNPEKQFYKRSSNEPKKGAEGGQVVDHKNGSEHVLTELQRKRGLDNPTPVMLQLLGLRKLKVRASSGQTTPTKRGRSDSVSMAPEDIPTPAMEEVMQQRLQRRQSSSPEPLRQRARVGRSQTLLVPPTLVPEPLPTRRRQTRTIKRPATAPVLVAETPVFAPPATQLPVAGRSRSRPARPTSLDLLLNSDGEEADMETRAKLRSRPAPRSSSSKLCSPSSSAPSKASSTKSLSEPTAAKKRKYLPLKQDISFRLKVLMSLEGESSCGSERSSSVCSSAGGSSYEPSEWGEWEPSVVRTGRRVSTPEPRRCLRGQRRVTRNYGKL